MSYDTIQIKIVLIGKTNVGKTSILNQYIYKKYIDFSQPTIGAAFFTKEYDILYSPEDYSIYMPNTTTELDKKKLKVKLAIWDTAGLERYNSLVPMYYRGAQIIIFVKEATNQLITEPNILIYNSIMNIKNDIFESIDSNAVKYLTFNKCDILNDSSIYNKESNYDNKYNIKIKFVSAYKNINIDTLFSSAISDYIRLNIKTLLQNIEANNISLKSSNKQNSCC